jgi:hypothetical protein
MKYNEAKIISEAVDYLIDGDPVNPNEQGREVWEAILDATDGGVFDNFKQTQEEFDGMVKKLTPVIIEAMKAKMFEGRMTALGEAGWNILDDEWLGGASGRNNVQLSIKCDEAGIIDEFEVTVDTMYLGKGEGLEEHELTGTKVTFDFEGFIPSPTQVKLDLITRFTLSIPD